MSTFKRFIASVLLASTAMMGLPLTVNAGLVSTEEVATTAVADGQRDKVQAFLARDDVRAALEKQGVDAVAASERVQAMTDAEVAQLADRVDMAPAGAGIAGLALTVLVVLIVTDLLGLTKIFTFTGSLRR
jgi:hypothetical protein